MERARPSLIVLVVVLLAANLFALARVMPAEAQSQQREETKQYKVDPTNLGLDLETRINAMAAKGWQLKQVIYTQGMTTTWVVYEK